MALHHSDVSATFVWHQEHVSVIGWVRAGVLLVKYPQSDLLSSPSLRLLLSEHRFLSLLKFL